jgi:hypothetical protein
MAIPALAAVPRLVSWDTGEMPLPVGVVVMAAHAGDPEAKVQDCVTAQQPPPMLEGQPIWLVVQPGGSWETMVMAVLVVLVQKHWLLLAQVWP